MPMFMVAITRNARAVEQAIEELKVPYYDLKPDLFVLRTVCWMFLWPSHACSALVSWPALARA